MSLGKTEHMLTGFEKHFAGLLSNPILICGSQHLLSIFCFFVLVDKNDVETARQLWLLSCASFANL